MTARLSVIALALASAAAPVFASEVPDPDYCSVVPCDAMMGVLTTPHSGSGPEATQFVVTVMFDPVTPIPNAFVELIVRQPAHHHFCPGAVLTGTTNAQGQVTLNPALGGCTLAHDMIRIRANNVDIRMYDRLLSPDFDGEADGRVHISDFAFFGSRFVAGAPGCTDYYNDGRTGIDDFSAFADCWSRSCTQ